MPRGRFWCFSSFSEVDPAVAYVDVSNHGRVQYSCYQRERCASTGRLHWQGYVEFTSACSQSECKAVLGRQCHVELARGGLEANKAYCTKEDTRVAGPFFFGVELGEQRGRRTDLRVAAAAIRDGGSLVDLIGSDPDLFVKYHRGFDALCNRIVVPRDPDQPPDVRVYHGLSGAGKTRSVHSEFRADQIYQKNGSNKWWCGYTGQACILFDDFSGSLEIPPTELLRITDRYAHGVETKGGRVVLARSVIIFTTMVHWSLWYRASEDWQVQRAAFERRVSRFVQYPLPVDSVPIGDEPL